MPPATAPPPPGVTKGDQPVKATFSTRTLVLASIAAVVGLTAFLCMHFWPFAEQAVIQDLQEVTDSRVQVRVFHSKYFPYPGCTLQGVVFIHGTATQPLVSIDKVTMRGTYWGMLVRHVSRITAEGMHVFIPPFGSGQVFHAQRSEITIGEIVADGATVEFALHNPVKPPLRFDIRQALLHDLGWESAFTYRLRVHNPEPPGEIVTNGQFGAWNHDDPARTPLSGEYRLEQADLSVYLGIAGILSSTGKFGGRLGHIDISGTTDTADFEVKSGGHPVRLVTEFSAYIDGTRGDTFLERVDANFRNTHVVVTGDIAKPGNGKGKTASLDLRTGSARIEDLVGLFVKNEPAPMSGAVTFRTKVKIPSGERPFLERVSLRGGFGIGGAEFSQPSTQAEVNKLSSGARGEKDISDPETVLTDLTGQVAVENGIARLEDLSFQVPGAVSRMHGTYNLLNYKIDLHGQMQLDSKISNTQSGAKALLLKMIDPFFKKRKKGEIIPVRISGTFEKPSFGLDLKDKKAQSVAPPSHVPVTSVPAPRPRHFQN